MGQATEQERLGLKSQEQQEAETYAALIERYGSDTELMAALAMAWRLGFSRAQRLPRSTDKGLTINPFWL